ncbi:MAG: ribose 5-phosphate isomerase B [Chloroflexota bacterium]
MRIALGTDHAGLPLKELVADWLRGAGYEVVDFGVSTPERVDYPDFIAPAARAVASGDCRFGFVFGGSGSGEQIVANKIQGIRCVQATEPVTARLGREHNDANMMSMGSRIVGSQVAIGCVEAFLEGKFEGGRHIPRIEKISALERHGS